MAFYAAFTGIAFSEGFSTEIIRFREGSGKSTR